MMFLQNGDCFCKAVGGGCIYTNVIQSPRQQMTELVLNMAKGGKISSIEGQGQSDIPPSKGSTPSAAPAGSGNIWRWSVLMKRAVVSCRGSLRKAINLLKLMKWHK